MTPAEIQSFLEEGFPEFDDYVLVQEVGDQKARVRMPFKSRYLRPGNTVSGPALMGLADTAMFVALIGEIGPIARAVTVNLNINFLRRPNAEDLIAEATLLKLGKRLAFGEINIVCASTPESPVAHATCTYAIPSR